MMFMHFNVLISVRNEQGSSQAVKLIYERWQMETDGDIQEGHCP